MTIISGCGTNIANKESEKHESTQESSSIETTQHGTNDSGTPEVENPSTYKDDMDSILSTIQDALNNGDLELLLRTIDPLYPSESFMAARLAGREKDAYNNLIPIAADVLSNNISSNHVNIQLTYVSDNIQQTEGELIYSVSEIPTLNISEHEERIKVIMLDEKWYVTCLASNDYLESLLINGQYEGINPLSVNIDKYKSDSLKTFQRGRYMGLCTDDCTEVVKPIFNELYGFTGNYCPVRLNNKWGIIDTNCKLVVDFIFDDIYSISKDGYWWICINNKWGAINFEKCNIVDCIYDDVILYEDTKFINASLDSKCGLLASNGDIIIPFEYEWLGRTPYGPSDNDVIPAVKNGYCGVIDLENNTVTEFIYTKIGSFYRNKTLAVSINHSYGVIDQSGNYIIPISSKHNGCFIDGLSIQIPKEDGTYEVYDFSGNLLLKDKLFRISGYTSSDYGMSPPDKYYWDSYWVLDNEKFLIKEPSSSLDFDTYYVVYAYTDKIVELKTPVLESVLQKYRDKYNSSGYIKRCYITLTRNSDVMLVHVELSGLQLYNLIDVSGHLIFTEWIENPTFIDILDERTLISVESGLDKSSKLYARRTNGDIKCIGDVPKGTNNVKFTQLTNSDLFLLECGWNNDLFIFNTNTETAVTLKEFIGVSNTIKVVNNEGNAIVVSDETFFGLINKNGLVSNGMNYTDYKYDKETGNYILNYGAEKSEVLRVLPNGDVVQFDEN